MTLSLVKKRIMLLRIHWRVFVPLWDNQMLDLLILSSEGMFSQFMHRSKHRIKSYQLGTQRGVLHDGRRFLLLIKDVEGKWMTRIRGIEFKTYECFEGTRLDAYDRNFLEAMIRR